MIIVVSGPLLMERLLSVNIVTSVLYMWKGLGIHVLEQDRSQIDRPVETIKGLLCVCGHVAVQ